MGRASLGKWVRVSSIAVAGLLAGSQARAAVIDLATHGSSGQINGAWFIQTDPQPTGTGVIDPFVRIQNTGTEAGFNTDHRPVELDTKDGNGWTHSIQIDDIPVVTYNNTDYRQFLLDVNEGGNSTLEKLSLDQVRIFLGSAGDLHNYPTGLGTEIYSMNPSDTYSATNNRVELHYKLNNGSGSGDMFLLVPDALFVGPNQFVYLYSQFGVPNRADAGFEEWSLLPANHQQPPPPPPPTSVPLPAAAWAGIVLIGGTIARRRLRGGDAPVSA